jgi:hypothetical protein
LKRNSFYLLAIVLSLAGCKKVATTQSKVDACALLSKEEIGKVQGSAITETKTTERHDRGFRISQCYFAAAETNKSVSLMVTSADPEHSNQTPKEYWKKTFANAGGESEEHEREREAGKEKEQESEKPVKVEGVGDDAYWSADRMGGALYVLTNDSFIRLSLGGPDNKETKLEKSKELAKKALGRL